MARLLVLYYSSWGHVEAMARAVAAGAGQVSGVEVSVKRVPELVPPDVAAQYHYKLDHAAPLATPDELADYDGIVFGTPTRFGNMAAQMRNFLDQTGPLWQRGALVGKVGSVFTSTAVLGGQETTCTSFHTTLLHHGMLIVGLPYTAPGLSNVSEVRGGSPYGAATYTGGPGSTRMPSPLELELARFQGQHVATIVSRLAR